MSEDFPRPQDHSNTESNDSGVSESAVSGPAGSESTGGESSNHPERSAQPYPQAQYNTGEYRHPGPQATDPSAPAPATAAPAFQNPATNDTDNVADESAPDMTENDQNTGPLRPNTDPSQSTAAVWQPRPSGALAAEAWSSPTPTGSYPTGTGNYPTAPGSNPAGPAGYGADQYRADNPWASPAPGQLFAGQQPTGQFGSAPGSAPYAGYGQTAGFGYQGMPPASTVIADPGARTNDSASHKGRKTAVLAAALVLTLGAAFGAGALGAQAVNNSSAPDSSISQLSTSPVVSDSQPVVNGSVESVAAKLLPSVVSILSVSSDGSAEGSGVILSSDGLILTNNHVITGATTLTVKFNDGTTATAKVIGADATDDLAVIKVSGVSGLTVATLGSSANVKVGEQVVAVGSPLGLSATVTSGIVSALNRPVRTAAETTPTDPQDPFGQGQGQGNTQTPTPAPHRTPCSTPSRPTPPSTRVTPVARSWT